MTELVWETWARLASGETYDVALMDGAYRGWSQANPRMHPDFSYPVGHEALAMFERPGSTQKESHP